jgi:predicted GNAT family acetyltransferase
MHLQTYSTADEFLSVARPALDADEAANNLMYGLALHLQRFPERILTPPYFGVVIEGDGLQAAALMTPPHGLIVLATDPIWADKAFDLVARNLRQDGWTLPGVLGPNQAALAFASAWRALTGERYELRVHERVYELRRVLPPPQPPGRMRLASADDLELATAWMYQFHREATTGDTSTLDELRERARFKIQDQDFYLWDDGGMVALAGRTRPTPHGCCVGPVYTPLEFRRKGYATALTAALSQRLLDEGFAFTALFTDLANPVSNSIYQKIGYRPVCDLDEYIFGK